MTRREWLAAASVIVTMTAVTSAQAKADFGGTWEVNREKTAASAPARPAVAGGNRMGGGGGAGAAGGSMLMGGGPPPPYVIVQTKATLTITRALPDGAEQKWVYTLDGSESTNTNARTTATTRSKFEAGKLVTEGTQVTTTDRGDVRGTFKEVRWIAADGSMHVQTTRAISGAEPAMTYQVFDRKGK